MKKKLDGFDDFVIEQLKDPAFAAEYLRESWEYEGEDKLELLLQALHRITLARGMTKLAKESGISRRNLYKMFSGSGNPSAQTLFALLSALDVKLMIAPNARPKKSGKKSRVA